MPFGAAAEPASRAERTFPLSLEMAGCSVTLLRVTHIGGPTTLLEWDGWRVLTDPTFDPPGSQTRKAWGERRADAVVSAAEATLADVGKRYPGTDAARTADDRLRAIQLSRLR